MAIIDNLVAVLGFKLEGEQNLKRFQQGLDRVERSAVAAGHAIAATAALAGGALAVGMGLVGKSVLQTASTFEKLQMQLEILEGSSQAAGERMAWLRKFALNTPLDLKGATDAYVRLKNYGMDPMNGSLQALVDTNAMMAGGQAELEGIIVGVGQAWSKQKLQAEEANQLLERGVPVWELLAKAMGKTVPEVMKLSEQGKVGRKEILLLIEAMGKRAEGASEKFSKSFAGIMDKVVEQWTDFKKLIADSGFFARAKIGFESILETLGRWQSDGTIQKVAQAVSDFFTGMIDKAEVVLERVSTHVGYINKHWAEFKPYVDAAAIAIAGLIVAWAPITSLLLLGIILLEDYFTYLEGGNSVIGKVIDKLNDLWAAWMKMSWKDVGKAVADGLMEGVDAIIDFFKNIGDAVSKSGGWIQVGKNIIFGILEGWKAYSDFLIGFWTELFRKVYDKLPDWVKWGFDKMGLGGGDGISGGSGSNGQAGSAEGDSLGMNARARRYRNGTEYGGQGRVPLNSADAGELREAITKTAGEIGATPEDLATLMSFETGGTFNKDIQGGAGGRYRGLIQFGPAEQRKYGIRPGMSISEQVQAAGQFFKDRGYKPGMTGEQLYATVNAGNPYKVNASDAANGGTWGTVTDKWRYQMSGHRANARKLLRADNGTGPGNSVIDNYKANQTNIGGTGVPANNNSSVNQNNTINVNVQKASDAPEAVGKSVNSHLQRAKPARMQASPAS